MPGDDPLTETRTGVTTRPWSVADTRRLARAGEIALRTIAPVLLLAAVSGLPRQNLAFALEFLALTIAARLLRVPIDGFRLDLEAAVVFPAVILSRSWELGIVLATTGALVARLLQKRGRLRLPDLDDAADLTYAYGASGFFFASLDRPSDEPLPRVLLFGATLIVFFFARVVLGALHAARLPDARIPELVGAAVYQLLALLLLSPVVALIVILQPQHGLAGTLLAFTSVALVSAALRNLARARRRTEELARQNRELGTLREISVLFSTTAPEEEVAGKLFKVFSAAYPARALALVSYEDDPEGRASVFLTGDAPIERRRFLDWLAEQRAHESPFRSQMPAPRTAHGAGRELVLNPALTHQAILPLQTPELIAGLLIVESSDPSLTDQETLQELAVVADHVALSMQDRNLRRQMQAVNERLQGRAEMLQRILDVSNELKSHLTLDHVLLNIVRAVSSSMGFDVVLLSLYDRTENVFERRAQVGLDAAWENLCREKLPREEIARWFSERFRISKSYFVSHLDRLELDDAARLERRRSATGPGAWNAQDLLFIPLTAGDQLVGVLQVDGPRSGLVPRLEDVQALEIFANQAVTAIQSARAYETTRQMSVRDSLTDAFNHRHFQETLYRELTRHERSGQPLALLMVDIDDFKKINDRWGHPVGDLVLRGLVEELQKGVREMDTVARYGGEEFAVILPETTPEKAFLVADRLRARIVARQFVTPEVSRPLSITVSLGLACFPEDANSKRALIERADQALYQAKRSGKNCVVTAATLDESAGIVRA